MLESQKLQYDRFRALNQIEPSADFTHRTMLKIKEVESRRKVLLDLWIVFLSMGPYLIQRSWLLVRSDYFSVGQLPFGEIIVSVYNFFVSNTNATLLLAGGIFVAAFYLYMSRSMLMVRFFDFNRKASS